MQALAGSWRGLRSVLPAVQLGARTAAAGRETVCEELCAPRRDMLERVFFVMGSGEMDCQKIVKFM